MTSAFNKNRFIIVSIMFAVFLQFAELQNYIYCDVYKEWTHFTNNMTWIYAVCFAVGMAATLLKSKFKCGNKRKKAPAYLAIWGGVFMLISLLSLFAVQTVFSLVKINSVNFVLQFALMTFVCLTALFLYPLCVELVGMIKYEGYKKGAADIAVGLFAACMFCALVPKHVSYNAAFGIGSVMLICSGMLATVKKDNIAEIDDNDAETKVKAPLYENILCSVALFVLIFAFSAYAKNLPNFTAVYGYTETEKIVGVYGFAFLAVAFLLSKKIKLSDAGCVYVGGIVYIASMIVLTFVKSYIPFCLFNAAATVSLVMTAKGLYAKIIFSDDDFANCAVAALKTIVLFAAPILAGYFTGVLVTEGLGNVNDVFASMYIEPFRTDAEIAKGIIKDADGLYREYIGLGKAVSPSPQRREYIPSEAVMLIAASGGLIALLAAYADRFIKRRTIEAYREI